MDRNEAIDEAVNILMDYHLRPHFLIEDTETDLDDEIYTHVHKEVRSLVVLTMARFEKYEPMSKTQVLQLFKKL